jgi:hypothetical protein
LSKRWALTTNLEGSLPRLLCANANRPGGRSRRE